MRAFPYPLTSEPDLRSPARYLLWLGGFQKATLAAGILLGTVWMASQAVMPFVLGRAIDDGVIHYETLDGLRHDLPFDFAMLIPPFGGQPLKAFDRDGADVTAQYFAPSGFMKVDADYTAKPYEQWRAEDWPRTYQVPGLDNVFAVGIAFAPPHQISRPRTSGSTPRGSTISNVRPTSGPKNPGGVTPITVTGTRSTFKLRPIASAAPSNRRCQKS